MLVNPRYFEVPDPFGRKWAVSFRWHQNAISIRHCDAVDVKWDLVGDDGTKMERVIALMHPYLLAVSREVGRELSDSWCIRLAAAHLRSVIETWEDAEKVIITPSREQIEEYARKLEQTVAAAR